MNKTEDFTVYKKPVKIEGKSFRTDGYYVPVDSKYHVFCFFENGLMKSHVTWADQNFWENPDDAVKTFYKPQMLTTQESYGGYRIKGDTLSLQYFNRSNVDVYARSVYDVKGIIVNDTTLKIISEKAFIESSGSPNELLDQPVILRFYESSIKPDSSQAWFLPKPWYHKELHDSRK